MTTQTQQAMIRFQDLRQEFTLTGTTFTALDGVNLDIADGEFVTVVGPSGCGKSTMLNAAAGLLDPTGGRVMVDDREVHGPSTRTGVIFQQYALFPWLTVRKNVEFGLELKKVPAKERRVIVDHYLELVGLTRFAEALPKELSGGMKQRCAIARAYAVNPEILLMDEPFGALDALTRVHMQEQLLATWTKERRTVMFVTHDVDESVFLASRVIVMAARPGRIYKEIKIDLPYPRTEEMRLSDGFARLRAQVWEAVYHQPGVAEAHQ
ncbi:ABC transporter ATP-binding protein [Specibacter sp. NPDC057265]|uniref:ABC transporter ATP-binding protein n=1 Tax=Specibacter sp. NPDC057265 TaxID=3346075 RepID=UPI00362F1EF6